MMDISRAVLICELWDTRKFDTLEIAHLARCEEHEVVRVLHIRREANRGVVVT